MIIQSYAIPFHPLADLFPLIEGPAFDELVADIEANGLREPIVLLDGQILDGRNRYRAAVAAGLVKRIADRLHGFGREFDRQTQGDPLAWVLSKNLHRRHLSDGQRAMVAARIATMRQGARTDLRTPTPDPSPQGGWERQPRADLREVSRRDAAEQLHVSERSVTAAKAVLDHGAPELAKAVEAGEVSVSSAADVAKLPVSEQLRILREGGAPGVVAAASAIRAGRPLPNGARAIMADRREPDDSLDFFPTPPWATRALVEDVLPLLDVSLEGRTVWEPACGEGHMSGVLAEYGQVTATDIFDYSADGRSPPGWARTMDFLSDYVLPPIHPVDWIITNPPFGEKSLDFALRGLELAKVGVALFVRQQWLEGIGRYERLFRPFRPALVAQFVERVPLAKGRWVPDGDTATAYCWVIWLQGKPAGLFDWIPPGRRIERSRPDDEARFTARPVLEPALDSQAKASTGNGATGGGETATNGVTGDASRPSDGGGPVAPLSRADAEPILRARYGTVPNQVLADELGVPRNTLVSWAHRMRLTDPARKAELARQQGLATRRAAEEARS